jgi:hypothetical protein
MTTINIYDHATGENIVRDMTTDELANVKAIQDEAKAQDKAEADKAKAKQAVLDRLGITADEAALLLG